MKKILFVLFLSFAFVSRPLPVAKSTCGGWDPDWYDYFEFYDFVAFENLVGFSNAYEDKKEIKIDETTDNLQEWMQYFKDIPKKEDVFQIVYKVSADDMQKIRTYILNNKTPLRSDLKNNSLVKYWSKNKDIEAIDYLFYAKVCEPEAVNDGEWEDKKRDLNKMRFLADEGKKYYKEKASNDFLKTRFAYQAIRMAHYSNQFDKVLKFYEEMAQPLFDKTSSIIRYWSLALKAGALVKSGQAAEGNYLFTKIFSECRSQQKIAYLSLKIENQVTWDKILSFCQTNEEKATLYFLRSLDSQSNTLEEMQNIYQIAPASERLDWMLAREINWLENQLLSIDLSKNLLFFNNPTSFPEQTALQKIQDLKKFVLKIISEQKVKNLDWWILANGYLNFLSRNSSQALSTFDQIIQKNTNNALQKNAEVLKLAVQLSQLQSLNRTIEDEYYLRTKALNHQHLRDFMLRTFQRLYQKQGEIGKAYLCLMDLYELKVNPDLSLVENLLGWVETPKMSVFEKEILLPKISEKNAKFHLLEIKATILFSKDRLNEAIALYQQIPQEYLYTLENNPFQANIKDCWEDCPKDAGTGKYNRLTLAQKIVALKDIAEKATIEQANVLFQLGNVYYNISHFGNSWKALDYWRGASDFVYDEKSSNLIASNAVFLDCFKAKYYFDRAMNLAIKKGDSELAAQACFMAAKCEQNQFYVRSNFEYEPNLLPENRKYFTQMKNEMHKTKFYQKAIDECTYFYQFVRK